jgi:S-ribosylhomocysteine lyase LuxS involved in autoinducer biosynthesis
MEIEAKAPSVALSDVLNGISNGTVTEKDLRFREPNAGDPTMRFALT